MAIEKVLPDVDDRADNRYRIRLPTGRLNAAGRPIYLKETVRGKRNAEGREAQLKVRLAGGGLGGDRQTTVATLIGDILDLKQEGGLAENTMRSYRLSAGYVTSAIGHLKVSSLADKRIGLERLLATIQSERGLNSRIKAEFILRTMLGYAVDEGIIERNPLRRVAWAKPKPARKYVPDLPTVVRIRTDVIEQRYGVGTGGMEMWLAILDTLIGSGVRIGELMALSPADIDAEAMTLRVERQLIKLRDGGGYVFSDPKTDDSGPRVIPVPKFVISALAATKLRNGTRPITLPWERRSGPLRTHDLYFFSEGRDGTVRPRLPDGITGRLSSIGKRLELPGSLTAHAYRHRYTTLLADGLVPQKVIDYVTGHLSSGSISLTVYTEVTPEGLAMARKAITNAWAAALEPQSLPAEGALG